MKDFIKKFVGSEKDFTIWSDKRIDSFFVSGGIITCIRNNKAFDPTADNWEMEVSWEQMVEQIGDIEEAISSDERRIQF